LYNAGSVTYEQKFTQPKSRYTEATLIKELESLGIGRPSTYASIIQTLKISLYVEIEKKKFIPTPQGRLTSESLDAYFPTIINVEYTSKMENTLDQIADGKIMKNNIIGDFYENFDPLIKNAESKMEGNTAESTDEVCPKCGSPMVVRTGKYGKFIACSGFPKCKYVKK